MDTAYLKQCLGDSLARCLAEVSEKRPRDPIEYIAQWLYKHIENQNNNAQTQKEIEELEEQRLNHEKEERLRVKRREEAKKIAEREAEKKRQEEERAKKENTSPTKLPVVIEAQEPSEEAKTPASEEKPDQEPATEEKPAEDPEGETAAPEEPKAEEEPEATEEPKEPEQEEDAS